MEGQEDHILWEDEKAGNADSEHDSLSSECEKDNGNYDKTKADTDNINADHGRISENE